MSTSSASPDGDRMRSDEVPDAQPSLGSGHHSQPQQQEKEGQSHGASINSLLAAPEIITPPGSSSPGRRTALHAKGPSIISDRRKSTGHSPRLSPSPVAGPSSGTLSRSPSSSSTGTHHRHARSRSVNLSPVLHTSPALSGVRWDAGGSQIDDGAPLANGMGQQSMHSGNFAHYPHQMHHPHFQHAHPDPTFSLGHLQTPDAAGPSASSTSKSTSPHLRPTSPIYINVSGLDLRQPGSNISPGSAGSSDGSVGSHGQYELSASPELRKSMLSARGMEKANSTGSLGAGAHSPHSPHAASLRRAASPSRAFPIPLSPRLQAFGSSSPGKALSHQRRLSGGMLEPVVRSSSPSIGAISPMRRSASPSLASGKTINPDPELPPDFAWPAHHDVMMARPETVPVSSHSTLTTPVPPSLRDEVHGRDSINGITNIPMPGSSVGSPRLQPRAYDHFSTSPTTRRRRTPSPSSSANLRAVSPRILEEGASRSSNGEGHYNLPNGYGYGKYAIGRHRKARSTASSDSSEGHDELEASSSPPFLARDEISQQVSPTHRIVSRPQGSQAKVEAHNALAHVSRSDELSQSSPREEVPSLRLPEAQDDENGDGDESGRSDPPSYHEVAHPTLHRRASMERRSPVIPAMPRPMLDGSGAAYTNGVPFRAHSPAMRGATPTAPSMLLGESPPKTRSFIGLPPRSGYDLSDDPDDVGSEDGSVGSGRDSIGTDSEDERDDNDDNDDRLESSSDGDADEVRDDAREERSQPLLQPRPAMPPKRPSLTHGSVVAPMPMPVRHSWSEAGASRNEDAGGEGGDDDIEPDDGLDSEEGPDVEAGQTADGSFEQGVPIAEDTLSTLERIFLFAKSEMTYHRILVSHSLADWILDVELSEAVEFVIPLLNGLACDSNEVCLAFAPQLHRVMWHFYRNCPLAEEADEGREAATEGAAAGVDGKEGSAELATRPRISVKAFSPLLCAMLLNSNANIANATQMAIVFFCARLQGFSLIGDAFDAEESEVTAQQPTPTSGVKTQDRRPFDQGTAFIQDAAAREDRRVQLQDYDFPESARHLIREEVLRSVGLAIGNLHSDRHDAREGGELEEVPQQGDEQQSMAAVHGSSAEGSVLGEGDNEALGQGGARPETQSAQAEAPQQVDEAPVAEQGAQSTSGNADDDMHEDGEAEKPNETSALQEGAGDTSMASGGLGDGESQDMSVEEEVAVGRMASLSLLAALGSEDLVPRHFLLEDIVPGMIRLAGDSTFFVRKEAAVSFGMLARSIGADEIQRQGVVDVFLQLCRDQIWHVRQAACLSLPNLFAQISDLDDMKVKLIETLRSFVSDTSRNVRVAALDIIGEAIYLFHKYEPGVPEELIRHFLGQPFDEVETPTAEIAHRDEETVKEQELASESPALGQNGSALNVDEDDDFEESQDVTFTDDTSAWGAANNMETGWSQDSHGGYTFTYPQSHDTDPDRPLVMAYNLPAVALTLGAERWSVLSASHAELCSHPAAKVRRSLAASLHELAKIIGEEAASRELLPIAERFIDPSTEKDGDVKIALLENIDTLLDNVSFSAGLDVIKSLHQHWPNAGSTGLFADNWRLREKVVAKVPHLAKRFLLEDDNGYLVLIVQNAIVDPISAVRRQALKSVSILYELFERHDQVLADGFLGMLTDIAENQDSYRARVATLQCLAELCRGSLQRSSVEMLILPRLVELSKDDIVDVRIALAALVAQLCQTERLYASPQSHSEPFDKLLRRLAHDEAPAVARIMANIVPADDAKRTRPPSPLPERPRRELILGPSDGGLHRPPESVRSYDEAAETSTFAMDEERDEDDPRRFYDDPQGEQSQSGSAPASEQTYQQSALGRLNGRDADWNMIGDAENGIPQAKVERYRHLSNGSDDDDVDGDEHMIVLPSDSGDLLLLEAEQGRHADHAFSSPLSSAIGDIDDDDDDERSPHHLLGIASAGEDQGSHGQTVPLASLQPAHSPVLESPDRGIHAAKGAADDASKDYMSSKAVQGNGPSPTSLRGSQDPFLAFVADKHTEWHGRDDKDGLDRDLDDDDDTSPTSTPTRGRPQQSLFEDDEDE